MKKLFIFFIAICLSLTLLAGCGSVTTSSNEKSNESFTKSENSSTNPQSSNSISNNASPSNSVQPSSSETVKQSNNAQSSNTQSSTNSSSQVPSTPATLNFAQKTDAYLSGATINDQAFINYYKNLGEYEANPTIVNNAIFASPNGNGNGSKDSPYSLQDALDSVSPGQTIYLRGGTYTATKADGFYVETKGNANGYITIRNYPNETPIITNSTKGNETYAFQIAEKSCYTIIEGLEISKIEGYCAYGLVMWGNGQNHYIIRNNNIHDIKTTSKDPEHETESGANAVLLLGENTNAISNVIIANNQMHNNVTGWAETCSVASNCEYVYILENNVYDNTNIGIDFYGNAGYCSSQSLDQPRYGVAAGNVIRNSFCSYADCAGLYCDGARDIIFQFNLIENCQYGIEIGSEEKNDSYPVKNILVRNNIVANNSICGIRVGGYETNSTGYVKATKFINNTLSNNATGSYGAEIIIAKVDGIEWINNLIVHQSTNEFVSTDFNSSYSKNITFTSNLFASTTQSSNQFKFSMFQNNQTGLTAFDSVMKCTTLTGNVGLDTKYYPSTNSVAFDCGVTADYGSYDFYLNSRVNGSKIDIGACEK